MNLRELVGSGDKIARVWVPILVVGVLLNILWPDLFSVGGPPPALQVVSWLVLIVGLVLWLWSVALILTRVPKGELVTSGPYALVKHPIYTSVALLVLPWLGFLLNTWLGVVLGAALYLASRKYAPEEERQLADKFGGAWNEYCLKVRLPWL